MRNIKIGDKLQIHCYKHDGTLYRICDEATVLEVTEDRLVCANYKTEICEHESMENKRFHKYYTREPAILFFYKNSWFNIIAQMKDKGIYYYCNVASPYIIDDGLIKYIDYDLDLRVYPDGNYKVLDRNEYLYHKQSLNYGAKLDIVIQHELSELIAKKMKSISPFIEKEIVEYLNIYEKIRKEPAK